jgi:hypothetical protein
MLPVTLTRRDVEKVRLTQPANLRQQSGEGKQRLLEASRHILGNAGTAYLQSLQTLADEQGVGPRAGQPASVTGASIKGASVENLCAIVPSDRLGAIHEFPPCEHRPAGFRDRCGDGYGHIMQGHRVGTNLDLLIMTTSALHDLVNTTRTLLLSGYLQSDTGEGALAHEGAETSEIVRRYLKSDSVHVCESPLTTKV